MRLYLCLKLCGQEQLEQTGMHGETIPVKDKTYKILVYTVWIGFKQLRWWDFMNTATKFRVPRKKVVSRIAK